MTYDRKFLIAFLVSTLVECAAMASSRPEWVNQNPPADASYQYYVGRTSDMPSESEAFKQATRDAREQVIATNFGVLTRIRRGSVESLDHAYLQTEVQEQSKHVRLEGFEQMSFHSEASQSGQRAIDLWVLFRYPVKELEREKERLSNRKPSSEGADEEMHLQDTGDDAADAAVLEVVSVPSRAEVRIDGKRWGVTPLRLKGLLSPGKHVLQVDHPQCKLHEELLELFSGQKTRIQSVLKLAGARLSVKTDPPGAKIWIGGKAIGVSPTQFQRVPAGEFVTIEIEHPEANRVTHQLTLDRDEQWVENIKLKMKAASLAVTSSPSGASVWVDGTKMEAMTPTGAMQIEAGEHSVRIEKEGYLIQTHAVVLRGGQSQVLSDVELGTVTKTEKRLNDPDWYLSSTIGFASSSVKSIDLPLATLGAQLEFKPWFFGLRLNYERGLSGSVDNDGNLSTKLDVDRVGVGLPVYFWQGEGRGFDEWYLAPEWYQVWNYASPTTRALKQKAYGGSVGYRWRGRSNDNSAAVWVFGIKLGGYQYYQGPNGIDGALSGYGGIEWGIGF